MLPYPLDESLQAMQPLVVLGDEVLVMSPAAPAACVVQTAAGVQHPLAPLGRLESIWKNALQRMLPKAELLLQGEVPRRVTELATSPLAYFTDYLEPTFRQRDFSDASYLAQPELTPRKQVDWSSELAGAARTIPAPEFVTPALWFCGRVWKLREQAASATACWQILTPQKCYGLSGQFFLVGTLIANWRREVAGYIAQVAGRLVAKLQLHEATSQLSEASREVAKQGYLERGDLLFVAGSPNRLGHLLPSHYNRTLRRHVNRDLAMTAPLQLPLPLYPSRSDLAVYERRGSGWFPIPLPHGLCLGPDPPPHPQDSPGVGLAALLRWAAQRCAENGAFHSADDADTSNDDNY